jgi:hypothetical protein
VIVASSHPEGSHEIPRPLSLDEDGGFEAEHAQPGRGRVYVLAPTPHAAPPFAAGVPTLTPIAIEPVEVRGGDETVVDVSLKDVIVSGRVTGGGEAAEGIRVTLSRGIRRSITLPGLPAPAADMGPPALEATTRDDGSYELLLFGPGTPGRSGPDGTFTIAADAGDVRRPSGTRVGRVVVPSGETVPLQIELPLPEQAEPPE